MIVGHELLINDLTRLADARELPHASLFFGPRRTGKYTVALGLARHLECHECTRIGITNKHECSCAERPFDVTSFDSTQDRQDKPLSDMMCLAPREKESIGVDGVRALQRFLSFRPNASPYRTAIVDGAESLTAEAQNALLKIAEEPPQSALIILVASDPDALLPTLRSRLQRFYFGPVGVSRVAEWLRVSCGVNLAHAREAAHASQGIPGLAWAMLFDPIMDAARKQAREFLGGSPSARKEFIKDLAGDESFRLDVFLEALLIEMASGAEKHPGEWHRAVGLRADAARFNLNPRLQLAALGNAIG